MYNDHALSNIPEILMLPIALGFEIIISKYAIIFTLA